MKHIGEMEPAIPDRDKVDPAQGVLDVGYDAWKCENQVGAAGASRSVGDDPSRTCLE